MSFGYYHTCTYWTVELIGDPGNPFDPPTEQWQRNTAACEWEQDNETRKDENGAEFVPRSLFYTLTAIPKAAKIMPNDVPDAEPPANAETVRAVDSGTSFPGDPIEYVCATE